MQQSAIMYNAAAEIGVGFLVIFSVFGNLRNIIFVWLYWNFLRMRYFTPDASTYHQLVRSSSLCTAWYKRCYHADADYRPAQACRGIRRAICMVYMPRSIFCMIVHANRSCSLLPCALLSSSALSAESRYRAYDKLLALSEVGLAMGARISRSGPAQASFCSGLCR